jgi:hypothetical protein
MPKNKPCSELNLETIQQILWISYDEEYRTPDYRRAQDDAVC